MTLVIGGMSPRGGIFIAGDTRASCVSTNGDVTEYFDDAQKVAYLSPFIIGFAGNSFMCSLMMRSFAPAIEKIQADLQAMPVSDRQEYLRQVIPWQYRECLRLGLPPFPVNLLVGTLAPRKPEQEAFLMRFSFPSEEIDTGSPGSFLVSGSGGYAEKLAQKLRILSLDSAEDFVGLDPQDLTGQFDVVEFFHSDEARDMVTSLANRLIALPEIAEDKTFNTYLCGFSIETDGKVYAPGVAHQPDCGLPIRFSGAGEPLDSIGGGTPEHDKFLELIATMRAVRPAVAEGLEQRAVPGKLETHFREGRFWFLDYDNQRAHPMRTVFDELFDLRAFSL